jgi:hypothetical protein
MARLVVPGIPHHFTRRGNGRAPTFFSDEDDAFYRALVAEHCAAAPGRADRPAGRRRGVHRGAGAPDGTAPGARATRSKTEGAPRREVGELVHCHLNSRPGRADRGGGGRSDERAVAPVRADRPAGRRRGVHRGAGAPDGTAPGARATRSKTEGASRRGGDELVHCHRNSRCGVGIISGVAGKRLLELAERAANGCSIKDDRKRIGFQSGVRDDNSE